MKYCPVCGDKNNEISKFCGTCGSPFNDDSQNTLQQSSPQYNQQSPPQYNQQSPPQYNQQSPPQYNQQPPPQSYNSQNTYRNSGYRGHSNENINIIRIPNRKDPAAAAIISFFFAGLGYAYNGDVAKGIGVFFLIIFTYFIAIGFFIHMYAVYDSYKEAKQINKSNGYTY